MSVKIQRRLDSIWPGGTNEQTALSAGAIFFLITIDIFGPFGLPYVFCDDWLGVSLLLEAQPASFR